MAFKLPFTAGCDQCGKEITTYAKNKEEANRRFRFSDWYADLNSHLCRQCKEERQVEAVQP